MAREPQPCSHASWTRSGTKARSPASASPARCTALSLSTPSDRVIRPAILWNDQRTGAECTEIEERIGLERLIAPDRQSRTHGLHGAEAALAAAPRAGELHDGSRGCCCRRTTSGSGLRASGRSTLRTPPARSCSTSPAARWSEEVLDALELPAAWLPPVLESPEVSGATRALRGVSRTGSRSPPARVTAPRRPSASASTVRGRCRS